MDIFSLVNRIYLDSLHRLQDFAEFLIVFEQSGTPDMVLQISEYAASQLLEQQHC